MLSGMKHQAGVQVCPRVPEGVTLLENDVIDSVAAELARRCQTRRARADHNGVMVHPALTLERFQVLNQCPAILVAADPPPDVVTGVG